MGDDLHKPGACAVEVHESMAGMIVHRLARVLVVCVRVCARKRAISIHEAVHRLARVPVVCVGARKWWD